jgi:hypothetical protein
VKKVQLAAVGFLGITSALGFAAPGAKAAAHTPKAAAKVVSLEHTKMMRPDAGCRGGQIVTGGSGSFVFSVFHDSGTGCVGGVSATLKSRGSTGLVLRTRAYSISPGNRKTKWLSSYVGGHITNSSLHQSIGYYQGIHQERPAFEQVCEAIVIDNHTKILKGPVCVEFPGLCSQSRLGAQGMKKVRYGLGVVGIAPVLGLMTPAAAAVTHPAKSVTKTVSLGHSGAALPAVTCTGHDGINAHAGNLHITVYHTPSTHCVGGVAASLRNTILPGLVLRTRAYSINPGYKFRWLSSYAGGNINAGDSSVSYYQGIHQIRTAPEQVCDAVVYSSNVNKTYAGPVCVSF